MKQTLLWLAVLALLLTIMFFYAKNAKKTQQERLQEYCQDAPECYPYDEFGNLAI